MSVQICVLQFQRPLVTSDRLVVSFYRREHDTQAKMGFRGVRPRADHLSHPQIRLVRLADLVASPAEPNVENGADKTCRLGAMEFAVRLAKPSPRIERRRFGEIQILVAGERLQGSPNGSQRFGIPAGSIQPLDVGENLRALWEGL